MSLTLWRGDHLFAELRLRPSSPDERSSSNSRRSFLAFLVPVAGGPELVGVWQVHAPLPGLGVQQYPVEPDIVGERGSAARRVPNRSGPVALQRMTPEEIRGVEKAAQLTIRDGVGNVCLPLQLHITEFRYPPDGRDAVLSSEPDAPFVGDSVWLASVVVESEDEALRFVEVERFLK